MIGQPALIRCAEDAARVFRVRWPKRQMGLQESFWAIAMDAGNRVVGKPWMVALGTANRVEIYARDVLREAIRRNACGVIVAHNHPTGLLVPSAEDRMSADGLAQACKVVGLNLFDALILTRDGCTSLRDLGLILSTS